MIQLYKINNADDMTKRIRDAIYASLALEDIVSLVGPSENINLTVLFKMNLYDGSQYAVTVKKIK